MFPFAFPFRAFRRCFARVASQSCIRADHGEEHLTIWSRSAPRILLLVKWDLTGNYQEQPMRMDDPRLLFFDGLLWYLETRSWAFDKLKACPAASQLQDIKMYYYLYFSNLCGAIDRVLDYVKEASIQSDFEDKVKNGFQGDDYVFASGDEAALCRDECERSEEHSKALLPRVHFLCKRVEMRDSCAAQMTICSAHIKGGAMKNGSSLDSA